MASIVCSRCGGTKEALAAPPIPGVLGDSVYRHICSECWGEWIETSIRVINHYQLHPASKEHREKLFDFMRDFLKLPAE
jgi:Fe-S cluster biosynthesis and repair protein YggX